MKSAEGSISRRRWSALMSGMGGVALVFCLALAVRLKNIGSTAANADELLHFYAAQSWLADGTLTIAGGTYDRTPQFTHLVAGFMQVFGYSVTAIRLPSALAGAAIVTCSYAWMRRETGQAPAAIAALMLGLLGPHVSISQFARPYAIQSLLFWIGATAIYRIVVGGVSWTKAILLGAFAALILIEAASLEIVSLIGLAGLGLWSTLLLTWRLRNALPRWTLIMAWAGGLLILAVLAQLTAFKEAVSSFRSAQFWALDHQDYLFYYTRLLSNTYGFLFEMLPIAILVALAVAPVPAFFCVVVFCCGLVLHSLGGMKAERYIVYLLPFLTSIWGLAGVWFIRAVTTLVRSTLPRRFGMWAAGPAAVLTVFLLVAVKAAPVLNGEVKELVSSNVRRQRDDERERLWRAAAPILRPLAATADVFIVDDDLLASFYVAQPDLVLNRSRLLENTPPEQYTRDYRTGVPTIDSEAALREAMACFSTGLVVEADFVYQWLSPDAKALLDQHAHVLEIGPRLHGFTWNEPYGEPISSCDALRSLIAPTERVRHTVSAS